MNLKNIFFRMSFGAYFLGIAFVSRSDAFFRMVILFVLFFLFFVGFRLLRSGILVLSIIFLLGCFQYEAVQTVSYLRDTVKDFHGASEFHVQGRIMSEPQVFSTHQQFLLESRSVLLPGKVIQVNGKVLVKTDRYPQYFYGDFLRLTGRLERPENSSDFSYQDFLAKDQIYSFMSRPKVDLFHSEADVVFGTLLKLKAVLLSRLEETFSEPAASLAAGILLGLRRSIPEHILRDFKTLGLTHILAVSGFNISLLIVLADRLTQRFSRRTRFFVGMLFLFIFISLTGFSASVLRAAWMGGIVAFARFLGRRSSGLNTLLLSGGCMVFFQPTLLVWDLSFQLSFLATLGLILLLPYFEPYAEKLPSLIGENLMVTMAAQVFVLPLILANFGQLSLISPVSNVFFLPFIPFLMLTSFLGLLLGWMPLIGHVLSFLYVYSLQIFLFLAQIMAKTPYAMVEVPFSEWLVVLCYFLLGIFLLKPWLRNVFRGNFINPNRSNV